MFAVHLFAINMQTAVYDVVFTKGDCAALLCECLASVSSHRNNILQNLVPDLLEALQNVTSKQAMFWQTLTVSIYISQFMISVLDLDM